PRRHQERLGFVISRYAHSSLPLVASCFETSRSSPRHLQAENQRHELEQPSASMTNRGARDAAFGSATSQASLRSQPACLLDEKAHNARLVDRARALEQLRDSRISIQQLDGGLSVGVADRAEVRLGVTLPLRLLRVARGRGLEHLQDLG